MTLIEQLAKVATAYASARDLSVARVSTLVFNDGQKLGALIDGAVDIGTRRLERAFAWFSDNWPEGADWPAGIDRPEPQRPAAEDDDEFRGASQATAGPALAPQGVADLHRAGPALDPVHDSVGEAA